MTSVTHLRLLCNVTRPLSSRCSGPRSYRSTWWAPRTCYTSTPWWRRSSPPPGPTCAPSTRPRSPTWSRSTPRVACSRNASRTSTRTTTSMYNYAQFVTYLASPPFTSRQKHVCSCLSYRKLSRVAKSTKIVGGHCGNGECWQKNTEIKKNCKALKRRFTTHCCSFCLSQQIHQAAFRSEGGKIEP